MVREFWYERATRSTKNIVILDNKKYIDPYPVTKQQADQLWGTFSKSYVNMAIWIKKATGRKIEAWCFIKNALKTRVFFTIEYPELKKLEQKGIVNIHFVTT